MALVTGQRHQLAPHWKGLERISLIFRIFTLLVSVQQNIIVEHRAAAASCYFEEHEALVKPWIKVTLVVRESTARWPTL